MAKVVEADYRHLGAFARGLEPARDLGAIQWRAELRMSEDEVVIVVEPAAVAPALELQTKPLGHRDGSPRAQVRLTLA